MTNTVGKIETHSFESINRGYNSAFQLNKLSLGLVVPIESYPSSPAPKLERHIERVQLAEELGYTAVWLRDVPFNVPSFGDTGQILDPFVYLGLLVGATNNIALGVASIILPLRHPAQVAKAAASIDVLSGGRLILGIASGDRPEEYPAMNASFHDRGERFRDSFDYIRCMGAPYETIDNSYGRVDGSIDMLPKPVSGKIPLLITGNSRQSLDWLAKNGDGWMTFPRGIPAQARVINELRARSVELCSSIQPVMQPLYVDLVDDCDAPMIPIHLGFRTGVNPLRTYLENLETIGVNHVALNLRFNRADIETTLQYLAEKLLPSFHH